MAKPRTSRRWGWGLEGRLSAHLLPLAEMQGPWDSPQACALSARCLLPFSWRAPPPPLQPCPPAPSCGFSSHLDSWGDTLTLRGSWQLPQRGTQNRWQLTLPGAQVSHPCRSHWVSQPRERVCPTPLPPRMKTSSSATPRGHRPPGVVKSPRLCHWMVTTTSQHKHPSHFTDEQKPPEHKTLPSAPTSVSSHHHVNPGLGTKGESPPPPTHVGVTDFLDSRPFPEGRDG